MKGLPIWYPDMNVWQRDCPISWPVTVERNGEPMDLSTVSLLVPVTHNDVEIGVLDFTLVDPAAGMLSITLTQTVFDTLNHYSLWYLRENSAVRAPLVRGRIVKWS